MVRKSKFVTPENSEDSGEAFTDGDFSDSDDDVTLVERVDGKTNVPVNEVLDPEYQTGIEAKATTNGYKNGLETNSNGKTKEKEDKVPLIRRDSHGDQNPSIVGIIGDQHSHAEQRLAARRAARAEAREIRMRELERQQREQENNADKAYDMYAETVRGRGATRLSGMTPAALHSPRRSSEDSDDIPNAKDLRHELKEVSEKFRKAMILTAQLDNDKAALGYQAELLKDRLDEQGEQMAQLQREHKEKCSAYERLKREATSLERELTCARDAVRARDAAAVAAGYCFVEATPDVTSPNDATSPPNDVTSHGEWFGSVPPLALVSKESEKLLEDAGEGTLDVRLQRLSAGRAALAAEVRALTLQLHETRAALTNGAAAADYEDEVETLRRSLVEARARCARAESEAALQATAAARLDAQLTRARAAHAHADEQREAMQSERRKLQREAREALSRVEELETENSHLTKRLDKLKNAKSALLKDL